MSTSGVVFTVSEIFAEALHARREKITAALRLVGAGIALKETHHAL